MHSTSISAVLSLALSGAAAVLLPSQDAFYTEPTNISSYAPGEVIRTRQVPPNLSGLIPGGQSLITLQALYQVLYRTTDALHNPVAAMTSILLPQDADPGRLRAYQTAYDTADPDSVPSYAFQSDMNVTEIADISFVSSLANVYVDLCCFD